MDPNDITKIIRNDFEKNFVFWLYIWTFLLKDKILEKIVY